MNVKFLLPLAAASLIALAACGQPQQPAAPADTTTETPATTTETPATTTETPAATPETNAMTPVTPEGAAAMTAEAIAAMTPEQKQAAVAAARKAAEDGAKASGLDDNMVKQAGDAAEAAAKQAMGL